jgi:uncharacterized RDD family membrane protein YckC
MEPTMYVLKRIVACLLDYATLLIPAAFGLIKFGNPIAPHAVHGGFGLFGRGAVIGSLVAPALILGVLTGLIGRTPGKILFFLRVQDHNGDPPGLADGILREMAKILLFATVYGLFYALASVLRDREALYDSWLGLEVDDLRPYGLTETQKKFRKYMREKERRERQGLG